MTKNIRERAPDGAEYFAFDVSGVSYFKIKDGIPHLWFEGSWEPVPDTVSEFMSLHPLGMSKKIIAAVIAMCVLVPILCFALLG